MTDIPALDAAVNEANAKVAELYCTAVKVGSISPDILVLNRAVAEREAALAARAAADKPKPLSTVEARRAYEIAITVPCSTQEDAWQAVLDAAAERWLKVIEALPVEHPTNQRGDVTETGGPRVRLADIRSALKPGGK